MLRLDSASALKTAVEEISQLPLDGKHIVFYGPYEKLKTVAQRNYWHKLLDLIARDTGNDKEYLKKEVKLRVYGPQITKVGDITLVEPISSEGLGVEDYGRLIDATLGICHKLNIQVPLR